MPLGDWATWVQSIVTVGALVAAVIAAIEARRVYERESARDERAAEDRRARAEANRRAQADKVAGWYGLYTPAVEGAVTTEHPTYEWCAFVKNGSDLPIYDVDIAYFFVVPGAPPGNSPGLRSISERILVVPPQEMLRQSGPENQPNYAVAIKFRDTAGVRWSRDINGELAEL
jgi:hypothetical protein